MYVKRSHLHLFLNFYTTSSKKDICICTHTHIYINAHINTFIDMRFYVD